MDRYEIAKLTREKKKASWNIVKLNLVS
jgi:hypothetical protein